MIIQNSNIKEKAFDFFINKFEKKQDLFYDVITLDEVKEKLNSNVNAVYIDYLEKSNGSFIFPTHEVFIKSDISDNSKSLALAHELWHGIALHEDGTGFLHINNNEESGRFFNEGITDCLAEDLIGSKFNKDDYEIFRNSCRILFSIINKKYFYKDYLYGTNEVEKHLIDKFDEKMVEDYHYVLSLLDIVGSYNLNYSSLQTNTIYYNKSNHKFNNRDDAVLTLENHLQSMLEKTVLKENNDYDR